MNEAPNNQTGLNDTFSSQPAPQTNPFTADLKGEFTSNFGTNTNAVSQIFKEGGFVNNNRTKYMIIGGVAIAVLAIVFFFMTSGDDGDKADDIAADETDKAGEESPADEGEEGEKAADKTADESKTETAEAPKAAAVPESMPHAKGEFTGGSGKLALGEPANGSSITYDETQGPAVFTWTGGGGHIIFSRSSSMHPPVRKVAVSGNSYSFNQPWPGTWYWQVQNRSGSTEVRSFTVSAPQRRTVQLQQPQSGGQIAGNGGTVSWQGDGKVAYYRVELSNGSWANPQHRFSSSGNSVQLQGVSPGSYQMRVGAFSEVAGRWEYTAPVSVSVQ